MEIEITKRKLTIAGKNMLWVNIIFSATLFLNLCSAVRLSILERIIMVEQLVLVCFLPILLVFWIINFTDKCFIEKYKIKLNATKIKNE